MILIQYNCSNPQSEIYRKWWLYTNNM